MAYLIYQVELQVLAAALLLLVIASLPTLAIYLAAKKAFPAVDGSSADPNRVIAKSDSLAMSSSSKNKDAAIQLIKYFVDDTAQKYTAEKGGKIPVTKVQYDESVAPPELSYVMDVFKNASATFGFYNESLADTEAGATFDSCFVEIFKGTDPAEALKPIQEYYESNVWK
jgi:raffinose/stachyose/melibiose transport system substrate-binding protein